jgi:hypothetical protein
LLELRAGGDISDEEYAALRSAALGLRTDEPGDGPPPPPPPPVLWTMPEPAHVDGPRPRPRWALPSLILGIACSLAIAWISADYAAYLARGGSPAVSFVYTMYAAPVLIVGIPLLIAGALGVVRPWTFERPWLRWIAAACVIGWLLVVGQGPMLVVS